MTKIVCVSDLHENLVDLPEGDLLLVAGDLTYGFKGSLYSQQAFLERQFAEYLDKTNFKEIVLVAGNHDQCIEQYGWPNNLKTRAYCLTDKQVVTETGLKVWGTPWQPWFHSWGFNAPYGDYEERFLTEKYSEIPEDIDVIVSHGPPIGCGDTPYPGQPAVGSSALRSAIERVTPKLVVCGHIHSGYGDYRIGDTRVINVSLVDNTYKPVNKPVVIDL